MSINVAGNIEDVASLNKLLEVVEGKYVVCQPLRELPVKL
jgi:hypothetical protein